MTGVDFDFDEVGDSQRRQMDSRVMALEIEAITARRDLTAQIAQRARV